MTKRTLINEARLIIQSRSTCESYARIATAAFAAQLDPTVEELSDIKTSVSEAVTNCIIHAYSDSIGSIYITLRIYDDGTLAIRIRDTGSGIEDLEQAMEPLFTTGGEERGGLGFTVMESFMDKLRVSSKPGKGTIVSMEKRIRRREPVR